MTAALPKVKMRGKCFESIHDREPSQSNATRHSGKSTSRTASGSGKVMPAVPAAKRAILKVTNGNLSFIDIILIILALVFFFKSH